MGHFKNLTVRWSKKQKDFVVWYPRRCDGRYVLGEICDDRVNYKMEIEPSIIKELELRGYDTTTLIFSVKRRKSLEPDRVQTNDDALIPKESVPHPQRSEGE